MKYANNSPFPLLVCELDVPTRPEDLTRRDHNKYAKDALRDAAEKWHGDERGMRGRFKREAKSRFHHFERSNRYKAEKAKYYHSTLDLVKTGDSREEMLRRVKIQAGGSATKGNLHVTLGMRFAFRGGSGRFRNPSSRQADTIERMLVELTTCDAEDAALVSKFLLKAYMKRLDEHRRTRKRIRISAR